MIKKYNQFLEDGQINELKFFDDDVIKFKAEVVCPGEYEDGSPEGYQLQIVPENTYTIRRNLKKGYEGWVIISGKFKNTKTGESSKSAVSFSPYDFKEISKSLI